MPILERAGLRRYKLAEAQAYTMRQLNQDTAGVIAEINASGKPAVITKHGRLVAMITPLEGVKVESMVLSQDSELVHSLTDNPDEEVRVTSTEHAAADLGIELPELPERYI